MEINKELRLRHGAENLYRASSDPKTKETVSLELRFVNSNLQLLKEQLADLNSSMELYQMEGASKVGLLMPMIPLGLKETKEIDMKVIIADKSFPVQSHRSSVKSNRQSRRPCSRANIIEWVEPRF